MNWEAIGSIGEIVGATATVLTLAYLALQIRQSSNSQTQQNTIAKADLYQQRAAMVVNMYNSISDPEMGRHVLQKINTSQPMSEEEYLHFMIQMNTVLLYHENVHLQHELGLSPEGQWEQSLAVLAIFPHYPDFDRFWKNESNRYRPAFRKLMDELTLSAKGNGENG